MPLMAECHSAPQKSKGRLSAVSLFYMLLMGVVGMDALAGIHVLTIFSGDILNFPVRLMRRLRCAASTSLGTGLRR